MKLRAVFLLAIAVLALGCQTAIQPHSLQHEGPEVQGEVVDGLPIPSIFHVVNSSREEILAAANVVFFWDGYSKFASMYFKHNGKWYATGGFVGRSADFIKDEAGISSGTIVYVTDSRKAFNNTRYGPAISASIARGANEKWKFYYIEESTFGKAPEFRQYYDEKNKKIEYKDY